MKRVAGRPGAGPYGVKKSISVGATDALKKLITGVKAFIK
jgi:hypothetical protein